MESFSPTFSALRVGVLAMLTAALCGGCATSIPDGRLPGTMISSVSNEDAAPRYRYFTEPLLGDLWSPKIAGWQSRERVVDRAQDQDLAPVSVGEPVDLRIDRSVGDLRAKYESFRAEMMQDPSLTKRALALELRKWIQRQAKLHYIEDGPLDHWATFEETLATNGDDCDGLELLVFHFMLEAGFDADSVYRAIVYRPSDGQHHMVTLWFEDPEDPWVIDPTGAMTTEMPRMSDRLDWVPLKLFTAVGEYSVVEANPMRDGASQSVALLADSTR